MNDYQEYRSYGSYLSRVFAIIVAFLLLVLAIWLVVRLANDGDDATIGNSSTSEIDRSGDNSSDLFVANSTDDADTDEDAEDTDSDGPAVVLSESSDDDADSSEESGQILATNTDEDEGATGSVASATTSNEALPNTGASPFMILLVPAVVFAASKYALSTQE